MASEIRVNKINSRTGVGTITLSPTGVDFTGITTAATLRATTGIVTSLTAGSLTSLGAVSGTTGTFTGDVDVADKIVHTGDTNTTIRFPAADTFTVETAGSERIRFTSGPTIGIGDNNPNSGETLVVARSGSTPTIRVNGASSYEAQLKLQADGTATDTQLIAAKTDGSLAFSRWTGSAYTEKLRLTSAGNIGINSTDPTSYANSQATLVIEDTISPALCISDTGQARDWFLVGQGDGLAINYADGGGSSSASNVTSSMFLKNNGNVEISNGNLVFSTSGTGIDFSATADGSGTTSSELLDDYEEGSWTPVIKSGTDTISYSGGNQHFKYTKIGNKVTVYFSINATTTSGTTGGNFYVEGLPFTHASDVTNERCMGGIVMFYGSGLRASEFPTWPHIKSSRTIVELYHKTSASANYASTAVGQVGSSSYMFFQITYRVA